MARIFIARTKGIGDFERHVVLKMILPERASDKQSVDMFLDEARLAAALNHQNVAQVFEVGQEGGNHYLAMEYVHGQDLRAVLAKAGQVGVRIPTELALAIVAGAAAGLHHAHDRRSPDGAPLGIVHRDVSPSNIMIGYDGAVKLLDFGIAKASARSVETQSGIIKGKFAYMSPEQCRGREVDRRSDVFSLGIILYEITTQHRCFRADSDFDTMHRIVTGDVVRPSRLVTGYPAPLEKIVMTALSIDPTRRYPTASALLEDIEAFSKQARLSPSTMALGRFMRELFGEVLEPWQGSERRSAVTLPPPSRENTVSNTLDGQAGFGLEDEVSQQVVVQTHEPPARGWESLAAPGETWPPKEASRSGNTWAAKPSSRARAGAHPGSGTSQPAALANSPATTLLDLPRGGQEVEDALDWDAKAYPQAQPTFASQLDVPVERKPSLHGEALSPLSLSVPSPLRPPSEVPKDVSLSPTGVRRGFAKSSTAAESNRPATSAPLSLPHLPSGEGKTSTSTAAAAAALPVGSRAFQSEGSQSVQSKPVSDYVFAADVKPRRRWWIVAAVAALVVAATALGLWATRSARATAQGDTPPSDPASSSTTPEATAGAKSDAPGGAPSSDAPSVAEVHVAAADSPAPADNVPPMPPAPPPVTERTVEPTLHLVVNSEPKGAEVFLSGRRLGVTPLSVFLPKAEGSATLAVRRARYVEASAKIDLSADQVDKSFSLRRPRAEHEERPTERPAKRCQDPESANPFDDTPICPQ